MMDPCVPACLHRQYKKLLNCFLLLRIYNMRGYIIVLYYYIGNTVYLTVFGAHVSQLCEQMSYSFWLISTFGVTGFSLDPRIVLYDTPSSILTHTLVKQAFFLLITKAPMTFNQTKLSENPGHFFSFSIKASIKEKTNLTMFGGHILQPRKSQIR